MKRFIFVTLLILGLSPAYGQSNFGGIRGQITDATGAAIPGISVTITDLGTNAKVELTTSTEGYYAASALPPVTYEVAVEAAGFQKAKVTNVKVDTGKISTVDIALKIGSVQEAVTVTAEAPLIQTYSGSVINTVDQKTIVETPLNGRNTLELALILPGAAGSAGSEISDNNNQESLPGRELSINGGRVGSTQFLADGADTTSIALARASIAFSPDTIQEFSVQQTNYSAQYARAGGAIIQQTTKSGTNEIHGNAFWFHRQKAFGANPFNAQRLASLDYDARSPLRRQQYGGTLGGPVVIPKIYNGKDRTFFFVSYEPTRQLTSNPSFSSSRVPTELEYNGDFSQTMVYFRDRNGVVTTQPINQLYRQFDRRADGTLALIQNPAYNPALPVSATNPMFRYTGYEMFNPNDPDPARRGRVLVDARGQSYVNKVTQNIARSLYPAPNITNQAEINELLGANFIYFRRTEYEDNRYNVKIDHRINDRHMLSGRWSDNPQYGDRAFRDPVQHGLVSDRNVSKQAIATWTANWSPSVVNELRANYLYGSFDRTFPRELLSRDLTNEFLNIGGPGAGAPNMLGYGAARFYGGGALFGSSNQQSGASMDSLGFNSPQDVGRNTEHTYNLNNDLTWARGAQTWKMGFSASHLQLNQSALGAGSLAGGRYNWSKNQTGDRNCSATPFSGSLPDCSGTVLGGDQFATYLLGMPSGLQVQTENLSNPYYYRWSNYGGYFQNDWKVRPNLTLNLGLRYQYQTPRWEKNNLQGQMNLSRMEPNTFLLNNAGQLVVDANGNPLRAPVFEFAGVDGRSRYLVEPQRFDFEPRFGFAWTPMQDGFWRRLVLRGGYGITHATLMGNDREPIPNLGSQTFGNFRGLNYTIGTNDREAPTNLAFCGLAICNDPAVPMQFGYNNPILQGDSSLFTVPANGVIRPGDKAGQRQSAPEDRQDVRYRAVGFLGDPNFKTPMIQVYNFQTQWEVMSNTVFTAGYQGSRGTHLFGPTFNLNRSDPYTGARPIPGYSSRFSNSGIFILNPTNSASTYHALTTELERRFYKGLQFRFNYTWSKLIDDSSGGISFPFPNNSFNNAAVDVNITRNQNPYDSRSERAVGSLNTPHTFNLVTFWELPFGVGKKWANTDHWINHAIGGWQLSTLGRARSGQPISVGLGVGNSLDTGIGGGTLRPDLIAGVPLKNPDWTPENARNTPYVNPRAFAFPEPGRYGNAARNYTESLPWVNTMDVSVFKRIYPWKERRSRYFELRTEVFNVFNHKILTGGGANLNLFNSGTQNQLLNDQGGGVFTPTGVRANRFANLRAPGVWDAIIARQQGLPTADAIAGLAGPGPGGRGCPDGNAELANAFAGEYSPACVARQLTLNNNFYVLNQNGVRSRLFQFALKFYF